jgi:hypothetical protein
MKKVAAPVEETEINGREDPLSRPRDTPLPAKKLELTSPTSGGRSIGIVRLGTKSNGVGFCFQISLLHANAFAIAGLDFQWSDD